MSDANDPHRMTDEEREEALREQLKSLRVSDLAYEMMVSLVTVGYQKLGLTAQTRELRDLEGAHLAVELLRSTLVVLEREAGSGDYKDLRSTLAHMQLAYVQAMEAVKDRPDEDAAEAGDANGVEGEPPLSALETEDAAEDAPGSA
jgi:hypothetical protein